MPKKTLSIRHIISYLLITFTFTWILWVSQALKVNGIVQNPLTDFFAQFYTFGAWGPFIAALIISLQVGEKKGIIDLFKKISIRGFSKSWLLPTFFLFPGIIGLPILVLYLTGQPIPESIGLQNMAILPIVFVVIFFNAGPLQEEFGWRGILQEGLQNNLRPLYAAVVTGMIWGMWHLPLFFIPDQGFYYDKPIWGLVLSTTLISILFAWIYNNSNKNLLLMLIFHTTYNFSHYVFPTLESDSAGLIYFFLLIVTVGIIISKAGKDLKSHK